MWDTGKTPECQHFGWQSTHGISCPASQLGRFPLESTWGELVSYPFFCSRKRGFCSLPHTHQGRRPSFSRMEIVHSPHIGFLRHPETSVNFPIQDNPHGFYMFSCKTCIFIYRGNKVVSTLHMLDGQLGSLTNTLHSSHKRLSKTMNYNDLPFRVTLK